MAPALLMNGLAGTSAAATALLLNIAGQGATQTSRTKRTPARR